MTKHGEERSFSCTYGEGIMRRTVLQITKTKIAKCATVVKMSFHLLIVTSCNVCLKYVEPQKQLLKNKAFDLYLLSWKFVHATLLAFKRLKIFSE